MSEHCIDVSAHLENTPEAVLNYIADPRNRPLYLAPLKTITDIKGEPAAAGTTWKWVWVALGMEWQGVGRCLEHQPGKRYSFTTEGGIRSTWAYTVEPEGGGTKLSIHIDYDIPEKAQSRLPAPALAENMKKGEAERVVQNLKLILDR